MRDYGISLLVLMAVIMSAQTTTGQAIVTVNITNVAPLVGNMEVTKPVVLAPDAPTEIWCNATITDRNGEDDIKSIDAVLWHPLTATEHSVDNIMGHYTPEYSMMYRVSDFSKSVSYKFSIEDVATPGTWICKITASDEDGLYSSNQTNFIIYGPECQNGILDVNEELVDCGGSCPPCLSGEDIYIKVPAGLITYGKTKLTSMSLEFLEVLGFTIMPLVSEENESIDPDDIAFSPSDFILGPKSSKEVSVTVDVLEETPAGKYNGNVTALTDKNVNATMMATLDVLSPDGLYLKVGINVTCVDEPVRINVTDIFSGMPISDANVSVYYYLKFVDSMKTDTYGETKFNPVGLGLHDITVEKTGYPIEEISIKIPPCVLEPTCDDGVQNQGETGIDCGGPCPPCECNDTQVLVDGVCVSYLCINGKKDPEEEGIDCGGPCPPCPVVIPTVRRLVLSLPMYVEEGDNITVEVIDHMKNPTKATLKISKPDGSILVVTTDVEGRAVVFIDHPGIWDLLVTKAGYIPAEKRLLVLGKTTATVVSVTSYLLLSSFIVALVWYMRKRRAIIVDEKTLRRLLDEDIIEKYKRVYTTTHIYDSVREIVPGGVVRAVRLNLMESKRARDLEEEYGIAREYAELIVLCKRLRAKRFITEEILSEELVEELAELRDVQITSIDEKF